jgi:hypothetical protein
MEYLTSPMKWCEPLYQYSEYIAEFWNSFSSLFFTMVSILTYYDMKNRKLTFYNNKIVINLLTLFSLIGPTSFLFHCTLNFYAQFLDELSVLLFLLYCTKNVHKIRNLNYIIYNILLFSISWFYPYLSPFFHISIAYFLITYSIKKLKKETISYEIWCKGINYGLFSVLLWILDFVCIINTHLWWHIFVSFSGYHFILVIIKEFIFEDDRKNNIKIINNFIPYLIEK